MNRRLELTVRARACDGSLRVCLRTQSQDEAAAAEAKRLAAEGGGTLCVRLRSESDGVESACTNGRRASAPCFLFVFPAEWRHSSQPYVEEGRFAPDTS